MIMLCLQIPLLKIMNLRVKQLFHNAKSHRSGIDRNSSNHRFSTDNLVTDMHMQTEVFSHQHTSYH